MFSGITTDTYVLTVKQTGLSCVARKASEVGTNCWNDDGTVPYVFRWITGAFAMRSVAKELPADSKASGFATCSEQVAKLLSEVAVNGDP